MENSIKHFELTHGQWETIKTKLIADFGTTILITWVQRRELGFSIREHKRWDPGQKYYEDKASVICVDFYTESARTYFLMKYYDY